jgi:hypothetical protein
VSRASGNDRARSLTAVPASERMVGDVATVLFLASRLETYPPRLMRHQAIE